VRKKKKKESLDQITQEYLERKFMGKCPKCGGLLVRSFPNGYVSEGYFEEGEIRVELCQEIDCEYCFASIDLETFGDKVRQRMLKNMADGIRTAFWHRNLFIKSVKKHLKGS
jgi:hypothetical protein